MNPFINKGFADFYHKEVQGFGKWSLKISAFSWVGFRKLRISRWLKLFRCSLPSRTTFMAYATLRYQQTLGIGNKLRGLRRKPLQLTN